MRLYLLRHGRAHTALEAGVAKDADRPLSPGGREDVRRMVAFLKEGGGKPSLILHSPMRRAEETAREAAELLKPSGGAEAFEPLSNALAAPELYERLKDRTAGKSEVLLVGHQPQMGELAAHLAKRLFELRAGGIVALDLDAAGGARVLWSVNPEDLPSA